MVQGRQKRERLNSVLLDKILERCETLNYAVSTGETYRFWCGDFLLFFFRKTGRWQHPETMGREHVQEYLSYLANVRHVSATAGMEASPWI